MLSVSISTSFILSAIRVSSPPPRLGKNSRVEFNVVWKTLGIRIEGNKNSIRHNLAFFKPRLQQQTFSNDDGKEEEEEDEEDDDDDDDDDDHGGKGVGFQDEGCLICVMKYGNDRLDQDGC